MTKSIKLRGFGDKPKADIEPNPEHNFIDATPTWSGILPLLLLAHKEGNDTGSRIAAEELTRMAQLADLYVAQTNSLKAAQMQSPKVEGEANG